MLYKDLIYKISTRSNGSITKINNNNIDINPAKAQFNILDRKLVGLHIKREITSDEKDFFLKHLEQHLYDIKKYYYIIYNPLDLELIKLIPELDFIYIADQFEFKKIKETIIDYPNLKILRKTLNKRNEFFRLIDYYVSTNDIEMVDEKMISQYNIKTIIIDLSNFDIKSISQKEKSVVADRSGWSYNSATGKWVKSWGWDGYQEINGW